MKEIQLLQQTRYNFEVLDFVRAYFSQVEPLDESRRFEKSFVIMPRPVPVRQSSAPDVTVPKLPVSGSTSPPVSPRPSSTQGMSRAAIASPRRTARPDEESIRAAILETTGDADVRTHKAYGTMQKAMAHFLKSKGASSVTITDQTKVVYDWYDHDLGLVNFFLLRIGSWYLVLLRLLSIRSR